MKRIVLLFLAKILMANGSMGITALSSWVPSGYGQVVHSNDLKITGKSQYLGLALRLPLTLLMGSSLEFGMSFLPDQEWLYQANKISASGRKRYFINSMYSMTDSMSALIGLHMQKQDLVCISNCNTVKVKDYFGLLKGNIGAHVGYEWLLPEFSGINSGIRVLYNFSREHRYCLGQNDCSTNFIQSDSKVLFQVVSNLTL